LPSWERRGPTAQRAGGGGLAPGLQDRRPQPSISPRRRVLHPPGKPRHAPPMATPHPTGGSFERRPHLLPVLVFHQDPDFPGLVYHANYVRYFERGRSDFLRLAAVDHSGLLALDPPLAFVVVKLNLTYRRPARIDDALVVRTVYDAVKGPRLMIRQSIERDGEVLCAAEVEAACIDLQGRPRRPPADFVERLRPWLLPVAEQER